MEQDLSRKLMEQDRKLNEILRYINTKKAEETKRTTLVNEFAELNTLDTFMKAKANTFSIGKVLFSFVKFDKKTMKSLESMDVYMDMDDALLFANDVLNGRIATLAAEEKAKGAAFPRAVWSTKLGGINEEKAKERGLRDDGKAISRLFNLAPGARQPFVFTAEQRPGTSDEKGLIQPEYKDKPEVQIRVACSADDLKKFAIAIQSHINAYRAGQYANKEFNKTW